MKNKQITHLYFLKALIDETVAKAFGLSEVAKIARTEKRLREYFVRQWKLTASRATRKARPGKSPKQIRKAIEKDVRTWEKTVRKTLLVELEYLYRLARVAGFKKASGRSKGSLQYDTEQIEIQKAAPIPEVSGFGFDLADDTAIKAIQNQQTFWLGEFVDGFSEAIEEVAKEVVLELGESPVEAGKLLKERIERAFNYFKIPEGFSGSAASYFEGLTANAVTVARVHGQLASFVEVEAGAFVVVNPIDERTCERCAILDGQEFPIERGTQQMAAEQEADTIDKVKAAHPWLSEAEISKIKIGSTDRTLSRNLAKAGVVLPPYHFRCRCTIDIV